MAQSLAIPKVIPNDWKRLDLIVNKIKFHLGSASSPTHAGLTLTGLTHSTLVGANASKALESVTVGTGLDYTRPNLTLSHLGIEALTDPGADRIFFWDNSESASKWLAVGNSIAITTTTIDTIQDIRTTASPTFANLSLGTGELTCGSINRAAGTLTLEIDGTAEISITATTSTFGGNILIPDAGQIGSASDPNAITISATGIVDITAHDGSAAGLSLGGTLVTSTAAELNLLDGLAGVQAQGDVLDDLNTLGANPFTGDPANDFLVGTAAGTLAWQSGATARTSIGLGTGDSPQFTDLTVTGDLDVGGDLDVVGHAAFSGAAVTALTGIYFFESKNITSAGDNSSRRALYTAYQVGKTGAADFTGTIAGLATHVSLDDLNDQDWTHATAIRGLSIDVDTESSSTGTITGACGIILVADFQNAATVTNYYGIRHDTPTVVNNKLTNAYGLYVGDFNTALTLNYAIYTNAGLVRFGGAVTCATTFESTGVATLADASLLKTSAAPTTDAMIANKKYVDDTAGGAPFSTKCSAYLSGAQTIPATTWTLLELDTEYYDTDGDFNTGTYRFVVPDNGYYLVCAGIGFGATGDVDVVFGKVMINQTSPVLMTSLHMNAGEETYGVVLGMTKDLYLEKDDYLDLWAWQDRTDGAAPHNCTIAQSPSNTFMTVRRVA